MRTPGRSAKIRFRGWSAEEQTWGDKSLLHQNAFGGQVRPRYEARGWQTARSKMPSTIRLAISLAMARSKRQVRHDRLRPRRACQMDRGVLLLLQTWPAEPSLSSGGSARWVGDHWRRRAVVPTAQPVRNRAWNRSSASHSPSPSMQKASWPTSGRVVERQDRGPQRQGPHHHAAGIRISQRGRSHRTTHALLLRHESHPGISLARIHPLNLEESPLWQPHTRWASGPPDDVSARQPAPAAATETPLERSLAPTGSVSYASPTRAITPAGGILRWSF